MKQEEKKNATLEAFAAKLTPANHLSPTSLHKLKGGDGETPPPPPPIVIDDVVPGRP